MDISSAEYKVVKVFNNNVVLVSQEGKEKILFEKGIGFGKHAEEVIENTASISKVFTLESHDNSLKFRQLIKEVDDRTIGLCEEIIYMISKELNEELDEKIHISLTDHIAFTLYRLRQMDEIENPFLVVTETLYKREFKIAQKAVTMIEKEMGIRIPDGETGFITLHIHSARNKGKLSNTIKYTYLSSSIMELIEDELNIQIDTVSLDYARFLIHIRFAIERIINKCQIKNELLGAIKRTLKSSYKLGKKVAALIEEDLNLKVTDDEIGYIAMHIERFKNAI
jgi:transcriptional antiterminator